LAALGFLVLFCLVAVACDGGSESCPVDEGVCDFGEQVEAWVQERDVDALVANSIGWDTPHGRNDVIGAIANAFGPSAASPTFFASLGCPRRDDVTDCSKGFSLVLSPVEDLPDDGDPPRALLVLGFDTTPSSEPRLSGVGLPSEASQRRLLLKGGVYESCDIPAGPAPASEAEECMQSEYFRRK
jgi:hypothetical protein